MTTSIIDGSLGISSFPPGYTGPGTLIGNRRAMGDVSNYQWYNFTSNGNAVQINTGFLAREVEVYNSTDGLIWEKKYGMVAANTIKTTMSAPTIAADTGSAIVINDELAGNGYVTLSATLCGTAKNICVKVVG